MKGDGGGVVVVVGMQCKRGSASAANLKDSKARMQGKQDARLGMQASVRQLTERSSV